MLNLTTEALLPSRQCFGQVYLHCKICFGRKSHIARQVARVLFVVVFSHVSISMITRRRSILLTNTANCSDTSFSQVTEILQYLVLGKFGLFPVGMLQEVVSSTCLGKLGFFASSVAMHWQSAVQLVTRSCIRNYFAQCKSTFIQTLSVV